jgi:hypothetical protein
MPKYSSPKRASIATVLLLDIQECEGMHFCNKNEKLLQANYKDIINHAKNEHIFKITSDYNWKKLASVICSIIVSYAVWKENS